jgi:outer membrane protein assembly factor BamB
MTAHPPSQKRSLLLHLLFPPAWLAAVWTNARRGFAGKLAATFGVLAWTGFYLAAVTGLLVWINVLHIEWRGGFPPVLTFAKTVPDYEALERDRARHASATTGLSLPEGPAPYWTGFRGPQRDGHYTEQPIRTQWPREGLPLIWRQPVGGGYASFAIAEGLAFTIEQRRDSEAVTAYHIDTGVEVWNHTYPALFNEWMGGEGPRATPSWHDGKLYALGAEGDFFCFIAATGELLWHKNILQDNDAGNLMYGMAVSPLIVDDKVIVLPGGREGNSVAAYDRLTGETVWKVLDDKQAYVSPMLVELAGRRQILVVSARRAMGLAPEDGTLLWEHPWTVQYENTIAQPVILGPNRFLLSAGYGTGCAAVEVTPEGDGFAARTLWQNKHLKNKFTSSVYHEGHVYGLDEAILTCIDAETGQRKWKNGRYEYGQVLLASGHLVILSGQGELVLVRATPEKHEEVASFSALRGKTWNHPAIAQGRLFVRNAVEMACFDLSTGDLARAGMD